MNTYECGPRDYCDICFSCTGFEGNPFDIRVWGIFSSPGKANLRIPGFYDGSGKWIIRFMQPEAGLWNR